jgi:hypothetical protein
MYTLMSALAILMTGTAVAQHSGGVLPHTNYRSISPPGNRFLPSPGRPDGTAHGHGHRPPGFVAAFPVFVPGYGYGYDQPAPVEETQPPPPAIPSNENFRPDGPAYCNSPTPQEAPVPATEQEQSPVTYLIGMKDHTIVSAQSYWVQGDVLTYITPQGARKRISLSLVDERYSKELNDEHNVDFAL